MCKEESRSLFQRHTDTATQRGLDIVFSHQPDGRDERQHQESIDEDVVGEEIAEELHVPDLDQYTPHDKHQVDRGQRHDKELDKSPPHKTTDAYSALTSNSEGASIGI